MKLIFNIITQIIVKYRFAIRISFQKKLNSKRFILVSNFPSFAVFVFIAYAFNRKIKFIFRKDSIPDTYFYRVISRFLIVEKPYEYNSEKQKIYINKISKLLNSGYSLCFFPEKAISKNSLINSFYDEYSDVICLYNDVSIVPVYVGPLWGTFQSYRKSYNANKKKIINVFFGRELPLETPLWKIRNLICELAADSEMIPRLGEIPLHHKFLRMARKNPFRELLHEMEGKRLKRFDILIKSVILSRKIRNIKRKSPYVGILLPNSNACAISILSVMYADCIPAMLNYSLSRVTLQSLIKTYNIEVIITSRKFINKINFEEIREMIFLEDIASEIKSKDKLRAFILLAIVPSFISIRLISPTSYNNIYFPAIVIFSSGSTGDPNGIVLTHHNVNTDAILCCETMVFDLKVDAITGNLPLFHSYGMMVEFWIPIMTGVRVTYIRNPLDYEIIMKAVSEDKLTLLTTTQTFLYGYIKKSTIQDFKSLRLLILGAEKFNYSNAGKIREATNIEPIEGYGCTELSPVVSINVPDNVDELGKNCGKGGSIGKALTGIAVKIVNMDTYEDCLPNQEGLLLVRGGTIMKEYLYRPENTLKAFIKGWYNTCDIAQMDEAGNITISGRISRFSKIAGEMISHELIETLICNYLGLFEKAIAVINLKTQDEKDKIGVLYSLDKLNISDVLHYLSKFGLSKLWIPKPRDFIKVESIPTLASGKLDLKKLRDMAMHLSRH
ncbi:MAG TPA: hypothetical protein DD381_09550 [Lentisphaeria bacterium]|nr:MAG: hypothetical protein A2X47_07425 [Lentisphaerae bacterium GWF2_38_69]HBM16568.1 hypothetical protein [Lentisphaeria bacterium]